MDGADTGSKLKQFAYCKSAQKQDEGASTESGLSDSEVDGTKETDLKCHIRTTYSSISKSSDVAAAVNDRPSSSGNVLNGKLFRRKRPVIFSSDDEDELKLNGDGVTGELSPPPPKIISKRSLLAKTCKGQQIAVDEREKCLTILRKRFPVLDYMECQEVLAIHSWSVEKSIQFLDALPSEQIDGCLSDQDTETVAFKRNRNGMKRKRGIKFISDSDSDDEVVYRIKPEISEDQPPKVEKRTNRKKKRKKVSAGSDSGDSYDRSMDVIYDSDASDDDGTLTPARNVILDFYQTAKIEELLTVSGCSRKKADVIVELRPFNGWLDLVCKFRAGKGLSTDLLNKAKDSLNSQKVVTKLMVNCEHLANRMESELARLMDENAHFDDDEGHLKEQPRFLNSKLKLTPYQLLGVNWLLLLHRQKVNGILADEMGLGKTIQATAFLTHLLDDGNEGPHLIVVPASTVDNWVRELKVWSPGLQVLIYQGNQAERRVLRNRILAGRESSFHIIIATYNLVISSSEDRSLFRRILFCYVIFDEAHLLKNMETQRYQNLMKINAKRRLLLTGTPMQNNLIELMSLLVFVMPNMFDGKREHLKIVFAMASKDDREETKGLFEKERISHAKQIMKPFVLRRLKVDVLRDLPNKVEQVEHSPMNEEQERRYKELVDKLARQARAENEKSLGSSGMSMVMQLRKTANHPLLMRNHFDDVVLRKMAKLMLKEPTHRDANAQLIFEDMQVMSDFELHKLCGKFKSIASFALDDRLVLDSGKFAFLDRELPLIKSNNERILLFSQFVIVLDIVEEYMKLRDYKYLRLDGHTPVSDRMELIDRYTNDDSIFVFLLSTKAGGLGINLTAASTVILHDIDFNPYNDKQAEDRCHRVGQTKDVRVIRLVSKNTIEEDILQMATKKLKLEHDLVSQESDANDGDSQNVASLLKQVLKL